MRVALVALFSERYPAIGESHGISVLAGVLRQQLATSLSDLAVFDMVGMGRHSEDELLSFLRSHRPDLLGVSVAYGTFDYLRQHYRQIRESIPPNALVVFGGALASYLPELLLREVDEEALVVVGEGESALLEIAARRLAGGGMSAVPGVVSMQGGQLVTGARRLAALETIGVPFREHIAALHANGAQIFTEGGRGCTWASCTFCLRGLLDIEGQGTEHRRFPRGRIDADLRRLAAMGIDSVTFADEDFLGGALTACEDVVGGLAALAADLASPLLFDASFTVQSIVGRPSDGDLPRRRALLEALGGCGLRKAFLGLESGSPTQLRRYGKGHTADAAARAVGLLRATGIGVEVGWIMFDPLCSLQELEENVGFLLSNDIVKFTSYLFSELRLQVGTPYVKLLEHEELTLGRKLFHRNLDSNTLSFPYEYRDADVADLVRVVGGWTDRLRPLHYPLKQLSRFGAAGSLGTLSSPTRDLLHWIRSELLVLFADVLVDRRRGANRGDPEAAFAALLKQFARRITEIYSPADGLSAGLRQVVDRARTMT